MTKTKGAPVPNQAPRDVSPENAEQGDELKYQWHVTLNDTDIYVDQKRGVTASFKAQDVGEYQVKLQIMDVFGVTGEYTQDVEVSQRLIPEQCDVIDPGANQYPAWVVGIPIGRNDIVSHNSLAYKAKYWTQAESFQLTMVVARGRFYFSL